MKTVSKNGTEWYIERTSKVGGPSQKNGLAFGKSSIWLSDDAGQTWRHTSLFSSYLETELFIKANTDTFIKGILS